MTTIRFKKGFGAIAKITSVIESLIDDKEYVCEIKRYREKRSLSANGYYWQLAEKISQALNISKDEVHEIMLQRYGTLLTDDNGDAIKMSTTSSVDPVKNGIHCRFLGESELNGETFYHYVLVKGSRYYDSKEFSLLVDGAVQEAKELGIETMTPEELSRLEYYDA